MHEFHSFYYDQMGREPVTSDFLVPNGTEMTVELLREMIDEHRENHVPRYKYLKAAYDTHYGIFSKAPKPEPKPDNRLAADLAYDISHTFEGYFIGNPMEVRDADEAKQAYLKQHWERNFQADVDSDVSMDCSKYGHAFEMLYQDEEGLPRSVEVPPLCAFMVYSDSVVKRPLYFVRYLYDDDGNMKGSYSDLGSVTKFTDAGGTLQLTDRESHFFGDVPAVEYVQNTDRRGLYEGVLNLIEAYNGVLSEKANDVEYFSDAYMVVEGMELDDEKMGSFKDAKLINLYGDESAKKVYFLAKPDADSTQENLISRLETLIFKTAMVPDITDESFSTASGTALKMRLMPMSNMAMTKERKFVRSVRQRLRLLANYPNQPFSGDDWQSVELSMRRNMPEDLASEAQVAGSLSGIVSKETQLSLLSCVDDPEAEMARIEEEKAPDTDGYPTARSKQPSMYEITSVLDKRRRRVITYNNAVKMLVRIGLDEEEAKSLLDDKDAEEGTA